MANDESKNFRLSYYQKAGYKKVYGDKLLQELLKKEVIDKKNLLYFCERFAIPPTYRCLVWQLLLKILPFLSETHEYILLQEKEKFEILNKSITLLEPFNETSENDRFLKLFLLESNQLGLKENKQDWHTLFILICSVCTEMFSFTPVSYAISTNLYCFFKAKNFPALSNIYLESVEQKVQWENYVLYSHLKMLDVFSVVPLDRWFRQCFANVIHKKGGLELIWDLLISSHSRLLIYVSVAIFLNNCELMFLPSLEAVTPFLSNLSFPEEKSRAIVNEGIKLWRKYEKK